MVWTEEQSVPRQGRRGPSGHGCVKRLCDPSIPSASAPNPQRLFSTGSTDEKKLLLQAGFLNLIGERGLRLSSISALRAVAAQRCLLQPLRPERSALPGCATHRCGRTLLRRFLSVNRFFNRDRLESKLTTKMPIAQPVPACLRARWHGNQCLTPVIRRLNTPVRRRVTQTTQNRVEQFNMTMRLPDALLRLQALEIRAVIGRYLSDAHTIIGTRNCSGGASSRGVRADGYSR